LFVVALGWLNLAIERNAEEVAALHATITVELEILPRNHRERYISDLVLGINQTPPRIINSFRIILPRTVNSILNSGVIASSELVSAIESLALVKPFVIESGDAEEEYRIEFFQTPLRLDGIIIEGHNNPKDYEIEFAYPYDIAIFSQSRTQNDLEALALAEELSEEVIRAAEDYYQELGFRGILYPVNLNLPIVIDRRVKEAFGFEYGDTLYLIDQNDRRFEQIRVISCIIVGSYNHREGFTGYSYMPGAQRSVILTPLSAVEVLAPLLSRSFAYSQARFIVDPTAYRSYLEKRDSLWQLINDERAGMVLLSARFWDEELRLVGGPLEDNLELMLLLYPIAVLVSVVIAIGFAALLLLQKAKEAALMRMLGMSKYKVCQTLCLELLILSILGQAVAFSHFSIISGGLSVDVRVRTIVFLLFYLCGSTIGAILAAISISNRKPMELLQVKE
jgi:hypothetical protein